MVVVWLPKGKDAASQQGCAEDGETRDSARDKGFVVSAQQRIVNELNRRPIQKHNNQQQSLCGRRSQEAGGGSWAGETGKRSSQWVTEVAARAMGIHFSPIPCAEMVLAWGGGA